MLLEAGLKSSARGAGAVCCAHAGAAISAAANKTPGIITVFFMYILASKGKRFFEPTGIAAGTLDITSRSPESL
jgi:hypothetical protein